MWQLLQNHSCLLMRQRLLPVKTNTHFTNLIKSKPSKIVKRYFSEVKNCPEKSAKSNIFLICSPWKLCTGVSVGLAARLLLDNGVAYCKAQSNSRVIQRGSKINDDSAKFDWKRLYLYLKPHKWLLAAAVGSALAVAFLNVYIPAMLGVIVNVLANMKSSQADFIEQIKLPAIKLISLYMGQAAFTFMYIHLLSQVGERVASQMKQDLFVSILNQDMAFFDRERTGELVNRLTVDVQDFKSSFKQTISGGLRAITQVVGSAVSLLVISPHLTGLTMVCVPSVVIGGTFIGSLLRKLSREAQQQIEKATLVAEEAISNMRTVRAFAGEENEARMFAEECEAAADMSMELGLGVGLFQAGTNLFLNGMVLATMFLGGHLMSTGQMSAGDVMAFLVNAQTVQRSVAQLSLLFGSVVKGISAGGRVFEYINKEPTMDTSGTKTIKYHEFLGDIEFKNVTFSYPTRPEAVVLRHFNLKIPAGKTVAIVGTSGNGKSTIAALLERFYDVNEGQVTIDGVDIREMDCRWLRGRALGLISQEPVLFATTVKENIRYGKPDASDAEIMNAAKTANAHEFILGFPDGYNTLVGERGMSLSGGQKQRIAIARAVLKNPPVLILDEATSALDSAGEKVVQTALETAAKGRTVLVIAHRLSTIMNADLIVVLNRGKIVEMGTHDQLKKQKGFYWNLIKQQDQDADNTSRAL
ncbi:mitochondrial potassium channel ATP-binding subunit isoform X2 [Pectinophora gossypiella]|uniref:mitochondrial potassium channel ATP-binding subunit isoform X1 n=1 Tax=Pectinophora gossypiella TaxID=13191 RepID=UPI00214EDB62|nr:mitochondrial potassium channel ATP-binding subunit isoform X1 [Pectinophora gossypiella]XP_049876845.1 mitochondrial potassium channel ATP-binding subunit isoform X2 [Pectinophora gossypiella]